MRVPKDALPLFAAVLFLSFTVSALLQGWTGVHTLLAVPMITLCLIALRFAVAK